MQIPVARFPRLRNSAHTADSGPQGSQQSNLTFSIGPWKLELERADNPGPKSVEAQALRPSLRSAPRNSSAPTLAPKENARHRIDPPAVDLREAFRRTGGDRRVRLAGPWPLNGQNCTVLLTDVVGFSSRGEEDCRMIRDALHHMTDIMLDGMTDVWAEGRGDGILTVFWPSIPTRTVVDLLTATLLPALKGHNSTNRDSARFQLRAAVSVGPLVSDAMGPSGQAITTIARLVEAPLLKQAMDTSGASLGLIATTFVYESVIRHDRSRTGYRQIQVDVKTFNGPAWMNVFGMPVSPHSDPYAAAA